MCFRNIKLLEGESQRLFRKELLRQRASPGHWESSQRRRKPEGTENQRWFMYMDPAQRNEVG